jgi:hemerythrin superfamily protein
MYKCGDVKGWAGGCVRRRVFVRVAPIIYRDDQGYGVMEWDILDMIEHDHQDLTRRMDEILAVTRSPTEATLDPKFSMMQQQFLAHMNAEEAILYPLIEQRSRELVVTAYTEHEAIKDGMQDLASRWSDDVRWNQGLRDLQRFIQRHIAHEEETVFNAARDFFTEGELLALGEEFEERMRESAERRVGPGRAETIG